MMMVFYHLESAKYDTAHNMFTAKTQGVSTWWTKTQDARETNLTRRSAGVF
eukprot:COSAG02_NODE_2752_length_8098_cov_1.961495_2_plen_51_part_00